MKHGHASLTLETVDEFLQTHVVLRSLVKPKPKSNKVTTWSLVLLARSDKVKQLAYWGIPTADGSNPVLRIGMDSWVHKKETFHYYLAYEPLTSMGWVLPNEVLLLEFIASRKHQWAALDLLSMQVPTDGELTSLEKFFAGLQDNEAILLLRAKLNKGVQ